MKTFRTMIVTLMIAGLTVGALSVATVAEDANPPLMIHAHAHNDYEHPRPLFDALSYGFYSVEADIFHVDGELLVAHDYGDWKGTFRELYLDPLQARVDENGSIYGDGIPFYLWIDLKDGSDELRPILHKQMSEYSMFTVFTDEEVKPGPVIGVITGHHGSKTQIVEEYEVRPYCRDSNHYSPDDPPADNRWTWYALSWRANFEWRGEGPLPDDEREKLQQLVRDIHAKGRKVRFWAAPDMPFYWQAALEAGVDHINTDDLEGLYEFLSNPAAQ